MINVLKVLHRYIVYFLLMGFIISCCMGLFVTVMASSMDITLTADDIGMAAKLTFGNVLFLSFVCTWIDFFRRKLTVERPVQEIINGAKTMMEGNFHVRIPHMNTLDKEDGLNEIIDCLNNMAQELSSMETLRTDFVANVSHELKTPLAVIQNYGMLLQKEDLPEKERIEYASAVTEASRRLADLITNILKLNKLENQQIFPVNQSFNLSEQLCECLLQFEEIWEEKEIEIDADIEEDVWVSSDPELLSIVWNNLLSNAMKFTEQGGTVKVEISTQEEDIIVKIVDNGCGMSAETGKHIFDKFYQGDTSHATKGNGLGLALVKRIINITQSEIQVSSVLGKGTTFTVKLKRSR